MKILAIDPGTRRTGLAACDELQLTTRLLPGLSCSQPHLLVQALTQLIAEENFALALMGVPYNMDGSLGPAAKRSQQLSQQLETALKKQKLNCKIKLWDERLTTFEAETRLREKGVAKIKAKDKLDSLAAQVLLEDYLRNTP